MRNIEINRKLAERIVIHFLRFEKDPAINTPGSDGRKRFCNPRAWATAKFVFVVLSPWEEITFSSERAEKYLAWLDTGSVVSADQFSLALKRSSADAMPPTEEQRGHAPTILLSQSSDSVGEDK